VTVFATGIGGRRANTLLKRGKNGDPRIYPSPRGKIINNAGTVGVLRDKRLSLVHVEKCQPLALFLERAPGTRGDF